MDDNYWTHLEKVIDIILDVPQAEREKILNSLCGGDADFRQDINEWLKAIELSKDFWRHRQEKMEECVSELILDRDENEKLAGEQIGYYRLINRLASGGMGVVYLAERSDEQFKRQVAVKIIRRDLDTPENVQRFRRERQLLADLTHPGIARLYDGGITDDGRQYLVMEYVEGVRIDEYCSKNGLSVIQILNLFIKVCNAVQYAHSKLILHRDLKPENILVKPNGQVCILDFGIAKLLESEPVSDDSDKIPHVFHFLSPEYAAPEQMNGTTETTATDVYALGTLLYVLLTDRHPLDLEGKSWMEIRQSILRDRPVRPSLVSKNQGDGDSGVKRLKPRAIAPDLDAIILKSLYREPENRYATVTDLMADLKRYQQKKPVLAQKQTTYYKVNRFTRRNAAFLSVTVSVLALIAIMTVYYIGHITQERVIAQNESRKAQKISAFMTKLFQSGDPIEMNGYNPTARELLKQGMADAGDLKDEPDVQSQMYLSIGKAYLGLGMFREAEKTMKKALGIREKLYGGKGVEVAKAYGDLGNLYQAEMQWGPSVYNLRKSLNLLYQSRGATRAIVADAMATLAASLRNYGKVDSAEYYARRALNIDREIYKPVDEKYLQVDLILAYVLRKKGDHMRAVRIYKKVLSTLEQNENPNLSLLSRAANDLAFLEKSDGNYKKAIFNYRLALAVATKLYGKYHPTTLMIMSNLAGALYANKEYDKTGKILLQKAQITEKHFGDKDWHSASGWEMLSKFYLNQKQYVKAEHSLGKSVRIYENSLGTTNPWTAAAKGLWSGSLLLLHKDKMAMPLFHDSFQILSIHKRNLDHPVRVLIKFMSNLMDSNGYYKECGTYRSLLDTTGNAVNLLANNN